MPKRIAGNIVGLPSPRSDWNQTDEMKADFIKNKPDIEGIRTDLDLVIKDEVPEMWRTLNRHSDIISDMIAPPITTVPNTLEPNKAYNFGTVDELVLAYPSIANDGDVIYVTFRSDGLQATNLIVSEINMHDEFDLIPEHGEGYELYAKYIDGGWLVKYSSYVPHGFNRVPEIEEE